MTSLVSDQYLDRIHQDALRVLEEVGMRCDHPEVRQILEETGLAAYDDQSHHLHLLQPLVEQALATVPGRANYQVGPQSFGIGGTAPFIHDDTTGELILPTLDHLVTIAQIAEREPAISFMHRGVLVKNSELETIRTIVAHCSKPVYISGVQTEAGLALAKNIHLERGNFTLQFALTNSPLNVIPTMMDPFLSAVRQSIPISISTMPMAGLSAPYSMSGLLTLTHAEILFGIVVAQVVNPGISVVHAGLPAIANLQKNYAVDLGLISHNLANILMAKVCERVDLPSMQSGCTTNEISPGKIASEDARLGYALMKKHGFHQVRHAFGFLKELVSFSIDKLEQHAVLCDETGPEDAPEVTVDPFDEEGFMVIARNGSTPNYMKDDHTLKNTGKVFLR